MYKRQIRYDVRGYGRSPASQAVYSDEEDLAALLRQLGVQKAYVVGLSLGGRIAIDFALAHPEMTDGIVPVAPGLSGFNFTGDAGDGEQWRAAQRGDWAAVAEYWLKTGYMRPAMANPRIAARLRQLSVENAHENLDNGALQRVLNPAAITRLEAIKTPTRIIVGDLDVADIHEICGLLAIRIPGAIQVVIRGSGHIVNMEKPEEFNRAVLDFLATLGK